MRINSFNGLRFFLITLVFLTHCTLFDRIGSAKPYFAYFGFGGYCVFLFLMLSGFCVYLGYRNKFDDISLKGALSFFWKRLIKIYPSYFISNIFIIAVNLMYGLYYNRSLKFLLDYVLQNLKSYFSVLTMTQAWIPSLVISGNKASWFVSCLFFCYLVSPFVIWFYNKLNKRVNVFILFALSCVLNYMVSSRLPVYMARLLKIPDNLITLFSYSFPIFRFFEFFSGMVLCDLFLKVRQWIDERVGASVFSVLEISLMVIFLMHPTTASKNSLIFRSSIFLLMSIIFVLAFDKGIVSHFFSRKPFVHLSAITLFFYLFHFPIMELPFFSRHLIMHIHVEQEKALPLIFGIYIVMYLVTLWLSFAYEAAVKKFEEKYPELNSRITNCFAEKNV